MDCPTRFNLSTYVLAKAEATPDKIALAILGPSRAERWSYRRLEDAVARAAGGLVKSGLRSQDKLLLRLGNSARFPIAYLGAIRAGIVPIPTSAALTPPEVTTLVQALPPTAILAEPGVALPDAACPILPLETLDGDPLPPVDTDADDLAYIVFTSGSSGLPKAVAHAHRAVWARRMMWDGWYGLRADDRLMHTGAFNWTYTLGTGLLDPWAIGATALVPAPGTDPSSLALLAKRHDASILAGSPGIFRKLLRGPLPPLPKLRHALSAGEALPPSLRTRWQEATGTDIHEALGMSEVSTFLSGSPARPAPDGTTGYPQDGRKITVRNGCLAVHKRDPGLMLGYINGRSIDLPLSDGWFETSDLVTQSDDGAYTYLGRADDVLTAGGFRIAPLEIEQVFDGLDGVTECAALTLHPTSETTILALAYCGTAREDQLTQHATTHLARHKHPRAYLHLPDGLPRGANGKLNRRALAQAVKDMT
ncbi:class I adenylate-forming enzyme family protein [Jannaschia sp. CCS1]|uniref:class I adenylate-forming enzyme family protein n=1 Tax=Jannaschia sp. (strain CCS1) TaxID=290400 RepID=UPI000053D95C|nr:class I adenylate-forming enzyme family protein [Jannaschia sp. CCS1]ABD55232.1 AMP-dependent synthetase and ligase [Jannaschia sp. CCS1]